MIIYDNLKGSWLDDLDHGENKYCVQIRPCLFIIINHCLFYYQSLPFLVLLDDVVTMFFTNDRKLIRLRSFLAQEKSTLSSKTEPSPIIESLNLRKM